MFAQQDFTVRLVVKLPLKLFVLLVINAQLEAHHPLHVQILTNIKIKLAPQCAIIVLPVITVLKQPQRNARLKMKGQTTIVLVDSFQ